MNNKLSSNAEVYIHDYIGNELFSREISVKNYERKGTPLPKGVDFEEWMRQKKGFPKAYDPNEIPQKFIKRMHELTRKYNQELVRNPIRVDHLKEIIKTARAEISHYK